MFFRLDWNHMMHQGNVSLDQLGNPGHELLVRRSVRRWGGGVVVFLVIHVFLPQLLNPTGWSPSKIGSIRSHHTFVERLPRTCLPGATDTGSGWVERILLIVCSIFLVKRSMLWNVNNHLCFSFCNLHVNQHWIFHEMQWFSGRLLHFVGDPKKEDVLKGSLSIKFEPFTFSFLIT